MKYRVYCDTGGYVKELSMLQKNGDIELFNYPYETKNKRIKQEALPSQLTWNDMIRPWDEAFYPWKEYVGSGKFEKICVLLSLKNRKDALHLDSAYKTHCDFFITSDKADIYAKRDELYDLLNITICLHTDLRPIFGEIQRIKQHNKF